MTVRAWRWLTFAAVIAPCIGLATASEPPATDQKAGGESSGDERAKLQAEVLRALKGLKAPSPPTPGPHDGPGQKKPIPHTPVIGGPNSIDPIREGINYFRNNDFEGARLTFQLLNQDALGLNSQDRAFVKYMHASALRRLNRIAEAEPIYRDVANNTDDEFLKSSAISQLAMIQTEKDLQALLGQLRSRAKSK